MAKAEWGTKRTCPSCGARFYDLRRSPIHCPKCDTRFEPDAPVRSHRSTSSAKKAKPPTVAPVPIKGIEPRVARVVDDDALIGEVDDDAEILVEVDEDEAAMEEVEGDDENALMEDASDLGGDDEDMAEVMEHMEDDNRDS